MRFWSMPGCSGRSLGASQRPRRHLQDNSQPQLRVPRAHPASPGAAAVSSGPQGRQPPPGGGAPGGPKGPPPTRRGGGKAGGTRGGTDGARRTPGAAQGPPTPAGGPAAAQRADGTTPGPVAEGPAGFQPPGPGHAHAAAGAPGGLPQPGRRAGPRAIAKARAAKRPGASAPQPGPPKARPGPGRSGPQPGPGARRPPPKAAKPEGHGSRGGHGARIPMKFRRRDLGAETAGTGRGPEAPGGPGPEPFGIEVHLMGVDLGGVLRHPPKGALCFVPEKKCRKKLLILADMSN